MARRSPLAPRPATPNITTEFSTVKAADTEQKKRITQLETDKSRLESRGKDRADELKGKGKLFGERRMYDHVAVRMDD